MASIDMGNNLGVCTITSWILRSELRVDLKLVDAVTEKTFDPRFTRMFFAWYNSENNLLLRDKLAQPSSRWQYITLRNMAGALNKK